MSINFKDPVWGVALMILGVMGGMVVILRDLIFKKKR